MRTLLLAALLGLATNLTTAAPAHATYDTHYAVVAVYNHTHSPVSFAFRWGDDGEWSWHTVQPGYGMYFSWPYSYPNENHSPTPYVRIDRDGGWGEQYENYRLQAYAAPYAAAQYAKKYGVYLSHHWFTVYGTN
jgi:hypothetical protein